MGDLDIPLVIAYIIITITFILSIKFGVQMLFLKRKFNSNNNTVNEQLHDISDILLDDLSNITWYKDIYGIKAILNERLYAIAFSKTNVLIEAIYSINEKGLKWNEYKRYTGNNVFILFKSNIYFLESATEFKEIVKSLYEHRASEFIL